MPKTAPTGENNSVNAEYGQPFMFINPRKYNVASNLVKRDAEYASNCTSYYGTQPLIFWRRL